MGRKIEFLENTARKTQGLTGSHVEQFRDNPYRSCARETGQNSNDARADQRGEDEVPVPVRLEYNLHAIPRGDLPFAPELREILEACLTQSRSKYDDREEDPGKKPEVQFFERAVDTLEQDEVAVLEIADFNTTGLSGPFTDPYSVFNSLVKADGDNNKRNADSGGSFGIGKNAAFAVSDLQTVVYSTLTTDDAGEAVFGCQARLQLISHELSGRKNAAEGYWGEEDYYAIENPAGLPDWLVRTQQGTSIFAIGFRSHEHWAELMLLSVVTNFLIAIMRGQMEFGIDNDRFRVNRSTLASHLNDARLETIAQDAGQGEALARTRDLHACLTPGTVITKTLRTGGGEGARLHILVSEELNHPRTVLFIRNGMYITDNLGEFNFPLSRFPGTRPFIAVVEPTDDAAGKAFSELLKRMENPEHNSFSPQRIRDDAERNRIKAQIRKLHTDIRAEISNAAKVAESDSTSINELARYFSGDPEPDNDAKSSEPDPERYNYGKAKPAKSKPQPPSTGTGTSGGAGGKGGGSGNGKGGTGTSPGTGTGGAGKSGPAVRVPITARRCRRETSGGIYSHRIFFTPGASGSAFVRLQASGLTSPVDLTVLASEFGKAGRGGIVLDLEDGKRQSIGVAFADGYDGPVEISSFSAEQRASA